LKIGNVEITGGFLLLAAWLVYWDQQFLMPLSVAACLLHEFGHYFALKCCGLQISKLKITAVGAAMTLEPAPNYVQEMLIALSGPGINLLLAVLLSRMGQLPLFSGLNLILGCLNLLPVMPLDGGRCLQGILSLLCPADTAEVICRQLSNVLTAFCLGSGLWLAVLHGNVTLLCVGVWMFSVSNSSKKNVFRTCHAAPKRVK